jgi:hypothetical protein
VNRRSCRLLNSDSDTGRAIVGFNEWVVHEYARTGGFTMLVVLVAIGDLDVTPLRSTYLHVIGDEVEWSALTQLFTSANVEWDGVLFEPVSAAGGGPVDDALAKIFLRTLEARIGDDRLAMNTGHFFDKWGRRMQVEEVDQS